MDVETLRLRSGTTLAYRDVGAGPAVLLLHGWPTSSFLWRAVTPHLAGAHRVVAVDLPGFGASDRPADARYGFDFFDDVLDELADALDLGALGVAGHDIGGPIAAHWALRRPGRVARLALLNTVLYPDLFTAEVAEFVRACTTPGPRERLTSDAGLAEILHLGTSAGMSPEAIETYRAPYVTDADRRTLARAGVGLSRRGFAEIAAGLPALSIPVGAVYGTADRVLGDVEATFARLRRDQPGAEITPVPGAGHFVPEEAPGPVGEALARFFA